MAGKLEESEPVGEADDPLVPEVPDAPDEPDMPGALLAPAAPAGVDGEDGVEASDDGLFMPDVPDAPLVPDVPELPGVMPEAPPLLGDVELGLVELGEAPALEDPELPVAPEVPLAPDAASEVEAFFACFFALCFFFIGFCVPAEAAPPLVVSVEDWARTCASFSTWAAFAGSVLMVTPLPVEPLEDGSAAKPAMESMARNRASEIFFIGISNFNFRW